MRRGSVIFNGRVFMWVLAMALLALGLASLAAPVFAQVSVVSQEADQFGVVDDSICSEVFNAAVQQYSAGDQNANANADAGAFANVGATADAGGDAAAAAVAEADAVNIANVTGLDVGTVNACLNRALDDDKPDKDLDKNKQAVAAVEQYGKDDVIVASIPDKKVLVDTGGMPLTGLLIAGLFLTAAGISLFRFAGRD
jgi:hypothetical protein